MSMTPTSTDGQIRSQLSRIQEQLRDLRSRRAEAHREVEEAKKAFAGTDFSQDPNFAQTAEFKAAEEAVKKERLLTDEIEAHRQSEASLLALLAGSGGDAGSNGNGHAPGLGLERAGGWNASALLGPGTEYAEAVQRGLFTSRSRFGTIQLGELAARNETVDFLRSGAHAEAPEIGQQAALPGAAAGPVQGVPRPYDWRGYVQPLLMNLSLLDLIPTGPTDANLIQYVQVTAIPTVTPTGGTAEGGTKPEAGLTLASANAPVQTIAGWLKVARQSMDDVAGLGTMINTLLVFDVRRRVLSQILAGDGTGNNLNGLYHTTGVGAPAAVTGDNPADAILRGITSIVMSDGDPNFVALNPMAWQELLLLKTTMGNYIYGTPGQLPGGQPAQSIWGLTITANRLVPEHEPLIGDATGCTLMVREGVNVKVSDSDQDDFVTNRVTVLAETRVAFPVWRPSAFAKVTIT